MEESNVVDTNVLVVANGGHPGSGEICQFACQTLLFSLTEGHRISVDDSNLIFEEYFRNANRSGKPGIGDAFAKWLWENQGYPSKCEKVAIGASNISECVQFENIPDRPPFNTFDLSDQKFLSVAIGSRYAVAIHNATDSDWNMLREALPELNLILSQTC